MTTAGGAVGALLAVSARVDFAFARRAMLANTEPGMDDAQRIVSNTLCGKKPAPTKPGD